MSLASLLLALAAPVAVGQAQAQEEGARERLAERVMHTRGKDKPPLFMEWMRGNADQKAPTLVLLHAARSSKGEYRPMLPRLKALGYNALAIDMVYGTASRGVKNGTAKAARDAGRQVGYLDVIPDIVDAVEWARDHEAEGPIVLWGSSFSASLALHLAAERPELVDGVIAFSPGEYFGSVGKAPTWIQENARKVKCPVFATSARGEAGEWKAIFEALATSDKTSFLPSGPGVNGSEALWEESPGHEEYWAALEAFLKRAFPAPAAK